MADAPKSRRKHVPLKVYCLEGERDAIEKNAGSAGLSVSRFLRAVGIGYRVANRIDQAAVKNLSRVSADLGRMGGLLKALMTNDERFDGHTGKELQRLTQAAVGEILDTQRRLRAIAEHLAGK